MWQRGKASSVSDQAQSRAAVEVYRLQFIAKARRTKEHPTAEQRMTMDALCPKWANAKFCDSLDSAKTAATRKPAADSALHPGEQTHGISPAQPALWSSHANTNTPCLARATFV
jgi:hypothetical protein